MTLRQVLQWGLMIVSVLLIGLFLHLCNLLVDKLGQEERVKVELWSEAYRQFNAAPPDADMTMVLRVMKSNTTIPVFYLDNDGNLLGYSNLSIPADTAQFIARKAAQLRAEGRYFDIEVADDWHQYLYYDESILLQQLHYYPYIQVGVIAILLLMLYFMLMGHKRAEQNRVWVGLSKETAHQLGTPIQSLMGWMEYLRSTGDDDLRETVDEMDKDVNRLRTVADRFSKIGSEPRMELCDLTELIKGVADYMQKRAPRQVSLRTSLPSETVVRSVCAPLFSWVIENLCRNAIDAMPEGRGVITITLITLNPAADALSAAASPVIIEVEDNGRGIPKKRWKTIFRPGFTTKQRGWGLGLALVRRIVEEYHHGRIYVKASAPGQGTTFRIEL